MKQIKKAEVLSGDVKNQNDFLFSVWQKGKNYTFGSAVLIALFLLFVNPAFGQDDQSNSRNTQGSVNENAKVSFDVPLANYPGRGLDLPVSLSYSSSVWRMTGYRTVLNYPYSNFPNQSVKQSVVKAMYAEYSRAGWKSSLDLPVIEFDDEMYDSFGGPVGGPGGFGENGCHTTRMRRLYIHMPDGSTSELRGSDTPYRTTGAIDTSGTFYAVDGSGLRYDGGTATLYLPNGTRYKLGQAQPQIIDRNGNTQTYNPSNRKWTDTLGREIYNPIPDAPYAGQIQTYTVSGINAGTITYTLKWKSLSDALTPVNGSAPALRVMASHYIPYPGDVLTDSRGYNFPQVQSSSYQSLFKASQPPEDIENPNRLMLPTMVVGLDQPADQLFNPVVLEEIDLPNGTNYKFSYNVYGELDKITYPSGAYEKYEFPVSYQSQPHIVEGSDAYLQAERSIYSRKLSVNGAGDDIREWKYINSTDSISGGGSIKIISLADNTRTDIYKYGVAPPYGNYGDFWRFGLSDAKRGMVTQKDFLSNSASDGTGGTLLRRTLTEYDQTYYEYTATDTCNNTNYSKTIPFYRTARPIRTTNIIFEGTGPALAQTQEYAYDWSHYTDTGVDQISVTEHQFVEVDHDVAVAAVYNASQPSTLNTIPLGDVARYTATSYKDDQNYRDKNILGLATKVVIKASATGLPLSQSETVYDEDDYSPAPSSVLGNPTSVKSWDSTKGDYDNSAAYLITHTKFDAYGNRIESTDPKGYKTITEYDATNHAYATKVTSPIPDSTGVNGSAASFESSATFDTTTGLKMTATDANGQTTTMVYDALTLRLKEVHPPVGAAGISETSYDDTPGAIWVKSRTQIDATNWAESKTYFDNVGRAVKTEKTDAQGNIFTETEYDTMGRVKRSTNPYRTGETKVWTTPIYDDLGRVTSITSPDGSIVLSAYGISTATGLVGTIKIITDQTGKKRKGITDAFGRMIRVVEDPDGQNLSTDYTYDTLGHLRKTKQGIDQSRYFMYSSLGRLTKAKQVEQTANAAISGTNFVDPVTGNDQWSVSYNYDNNGNIQTTTDARNITITGTYDRFDRLILRDYSDSTPDVSFYYDGKGLASVPNYSKGKTTKVSSSVSETRYTSFDSMGRLLTSQQLTTAAQRSGTEAPYTSSYTYNLSGAMLTETYPSGRVVTNTLNADGELEKVESQKNTNATAKIYLSDIKYNSFGALEKDRLGNGRWETMEYDTNRLQVKQIALGNSNTDKSLLKIDYRYTTTPTTTDNNGSLREQKISYAGQSSQIVQSYAYDSLNRLYSATETYNGGTQSWKQTFDYDRYGNRKFKTNDDNTTTLSLLKAPKITNPKINESDNRLKKDQDNDNVTDYDYDAAGNMTLDAENKRFVYDGENHQTQFFDSSNTTQTPDAVYQYDGMGKRVRKISGQTETIFVYNAGGALIAEYSTQISSTPQISYLTTDSLGSPRIITDGGGAVISRHDYMAFGDEVYASVASRTTSAKYSAIDAVRQQYTGYERDTESGLDYAQARYYNSSHGRFTSIDPLIASANVKDPQSFNRYSYVSNSPYKFTDPLGLMQGDASQGWGSASANFWGSDYSSSSGGSGRSIIDATEAIFDQQINDRLSDIRDTHRANWLARNGRMEEAEAIDDANDNIDRIKAAEAQTEVTVTMLEEDDEGAVTVSASIDSPLATDANGYTYITGTETGNSRPDAYNCMAFGLGITNSWEQPDFGESLSQFAVRKGARPWRLGQRIPAGYTLMKVFEDSGDPDNWHVMRRMGKGDWWSKNGGTPIYINIKDPDKFYRDQYSPIGRVTMRFFLVPVRQLTIPRDPSSTRRF